MAKFLILLIALFTSSTLFADEVRIAVAANFTATARTLAPLFEQSTGHKTKISYGSTGKLFAQISNGAPFDIFMSADTQHPLKIIEKNLAVAGSDFIYAKGKLILWSNKSNLFDDAEGYLKAAKFHHLAIANPKTAPYGFAAKQVLEHLSLWDDLQKKLVRGDSANQTFQFVATENAELGFVAQSQVKAWKNKEGTLWGIPDSYYSTINQSVVLLNRGENNSAAKAFLVFLRGDKAREIIKQQGYEVEKKNIIKDEAKSGL